MVHLLLDPRVYFPQSNNGATVVAWFRDVADTIIENNYSVNIVIIEPLNTLQNIADGFDNQLSNDQLQKLLLALKSKHFTYVYYIESADFCNDLLFEPGITDYMSNDIVKGYFNKGLCKAHNELKCKALASCHDEESLGKQCYCEDTDIAFKGINSIDVIKETEPFNNIYCALNIKQTLKIDYDSNTVESLRENMKKWIRDRYTKIEKDFLSKFEITGDFVENIRQYKDVIEVNMLVGSMVRTIIAPSCDCTKRDHEYLVECHENSTNKNSPTLMALGNNYNVNRTYVLEDDEHRRGSRLNRIISTNYNNKVLFLNYVHEHDITDEKIKKSLRSFILKPS